MKEYSRLFDRDYDTDNTIRIINTKQAGLYIKNRVPLIDLFWSVNSLVFVFDREKSKDAYDLWCKRELS